MPEWLIERGIGETRYALVERGEIVESRVLLDGSIAAGTTLSARLTSADPALARAGDTEFMLPGGAAGVNEGATLNIEVTREAIPGTEPWKRPLARIAAGVTGRAVSPPLVGRELVFPAPTDELEDAGWSDLLSEAREGIVRFSGGELRITPTPAMTLIDVDGRLPAQELALSAAQAIARTIRRHGIGGSIGIDFPTVAGREPRKAIGHAIDVALPQPYERTSVNGFGFLQIVRPHRYPSLPELAADRVSFEGRALLRAAARLRGPLCLVAHSRVIDLLEANRDWIDVLARQVGGAIRLRAMRELPMSAGYAEPA